MARTHAFGCLCGDPIPEIPIRSDPQVPVFALDRHHDMPQRIASSSISPSPANADSAIGRRHVPTRRRSRERLTLPRRKKIEDAICTVSVADFERMFTEYCSDHEHRGDAIEYFKVLDRNGKPTDARCEA